MLVVGLTGGIACGKSTVSELFRRRHGTPIIDADVIARELVEPGSTTLQEIIEQFGDALIHQDGTLNRKALRTTVFSNPEAKTQLESILHPRIRESAAQIIESFRAQNFPYCIYVIPLLFETDQQSSVDHVLVVDCDEVEQVRRVVNRDNCAEAEARRIINTQIPRKKRLAQADDILLNNGDVEKLAVEVANLDQRYREHTLSSTYSS